MNLSETEKQVLTRFMKDYDDKLGTAGCNDFTLPKTPKNLQKFAFLT